MTLSGILPLDQQILLIFTGCTHHHLLQLNHSQPRSLLILPIHSNIRDLLISHIHSLIQIRIQGIMYINLNIHILFLLNQVLYPLFSFVLRVFNFPITPLSHETFTNSKWIHRGILKAFTGTSHEFFFLII